MTLPQFPSQDLAKLVLGYLAEEQLMTAYDEFLQASPYLDALQNEYDRIFMMSLRNILAEYRAVKIYVETCKPFLLRKKLFQCTNLLDIVKFLVNHIDVNKIYAQEASEKASNEKQNATHSFHSTGCDACDTLKLASCACRNNQKHQREINPQPVSHAEEEILHNSVETTALSDLPGHHVTARKKQVKVLEKCSILLQSSSSSGHVSELSVRQSPDVQSSVSSGQTYSNGNNTQLMVSTDNSTVSLNSMVKVPDVSKSRQEIKEFNNVLKTVCNKATVVDRTDVSHNVHNTIPSANTFHDFASGVRGSENANVPDSSTSENVNIQTPAIGNKGHIPESTQPQVFFQVEPVQSNTQIHKDKTRSTNNSYVTYPRIKPKSEEQRVKILSDVKVDNTKDKKTVHIMKNATSTPLLPMQTIFINGKPAYRTQPLHPKNQNFTKDEIMAMPTIIVVPASGPPIIPVNSLPQPVKSNNTTVTTTLSTTQNCSNRILGPLVIDVSLNPVGSNKDEADAAESSSIKVSNETTLPRLVDSSKSGTSVPKDNTIACSAETSTPLVLPTSRKSSSTPRRTSHVRILDFTTPRRILHETINEQVPILNSDSSTEVSTQHIVATSHSDNTNEVMNQNSVTIKSEIEISNIDSVKENDSTSLSLTNKKRNWDADLRALAVGYAVSSNTNPKSKSKNPRKKRASKKVCETDISHANDTNASQKSRKTKKKQVIEDEDEHDNVLQTNVVPIKPTIHIKPRIDYGSSCCTNKKENDKQLEEPIKPNNEERVETPEIDRLSLQNVIGAKLNISELLETPYKQAFYDIQMDTPKYLGPDLPDDPMSDIKIMNIPTPRFFDSPKYPQATPSSYSSRPTDYSSGGSYYKPDDQDYQPAPDLRCPVTSSKQDKIIEPPKENVNDNKKTSRPVRKCAKNVSYFRNSKLKDADDKTDGASSCSDTVSINSSFDSKIEKELSVKISKDSSVPQEETKPENKKKSSRKRKSPVTKEKPKTFMKIKPRRTTPIKEFIGGNSRGRKRTVQNSPKLFKHRLSSKDKNSNVALIANSVPTKSRRKSSTPRKLHCSKTFNPENSTYSSPEVSTDVKQNVTRDSNSVSAQDSDTEQLALRWSDDGSQDIKVAEKQSHLNNDGDDISKIKEYIETTDTNKFSKEAESVFHCDLVKRGFDVETAKIIERDLLDTPPHGDHKKEVLTKPIELIENKKDGVSLDKASETNSNSVNERHITLNEEDDDIEEVELSIHECNENTANYLTFVHDDTKDVPTKPPITLKDKFSMEVCIDDGITIRLRATPFSPIFDQDPVNYINHAYNARETEDAVKSISNIDKLYTPLKESIKAQCFEIFDSTLTSLDTPLKRTSPRRLQSEVTVTEIILEEEKVDAKEKIDTKKRKRIQGSDESLNEYKKPKPDTQYLLASANIQNIDIESVLKKLHGP